MGVSRFMAYQKESGYVSTDGKLRAHSHTPLWLEESIFLGYGSQSITCHLMVGQYHGAGRHRESREEEGDETTGVL